MRHRRPAMAFALAACLGLGACAAPAKGPPPAPSAERGEPSPTAPVTGDRATVTRIVDGDTVVLRLSGRLERVRLIGIDTPETVDPRRPDGCFGAEASAYAKRLLDGRVVFVRYDADRRDRYGRLLAYLTLPDGTFVNHDLVERGYARVLTVPPNVAHAGELLAAERRARAAGRGLWDPAACP